MWKSIMGENPSGSVTDPRGPNSGSLRIRRGGCWCDYMKNCRSACRFRLGPGYRFDSLGFRLALNSIR